MISQVEVFHHTISNNDTSINVVTFSKTSKSVIFFCPTVYISKESFRKKAGELIKNYKIKGVSDLTVHFVYFKQDVKSAAKGLKYSSNDYKDIFFVGQFECLFIGFDTNYLQRSKSKMKFNYDIEQAFKDENVYRIPIVDTNKCFEKIPDRIPFYADFIKESILPIYSTDERFKFLQDSIYHLTNQVNHLTKQVNSVIRQNEDLIKQYQEIIDQLKSTNSPNKPSKEKPSVPKNEAVDPNKPNQ